MYLIGKFTRQWYIRIESLIRVSGGGIFTKDFCLGSVISACCALNYFAILINITSFAMSSFGCSEAEAGLSAGIYVIGGLFSRLLLGKYVELVGRKKMLIISETFCLGISCLYFFVSSMPMLYGVRFLHGMGYGIAVTCVSDIIARILPKERLGEGLGYYALSITLATAIGPYLGLILSPNYDAVFSIGIGMYSVAVLCAVLMHVPEETLTEEQRAEAKGFRLGNVLQLSAVPLGITTMVFFFGYSGVLSFIDPYSEEIGMAEAAAFFYLAVSAGTLISRLTTGKIFDTKGPNGIITLGILLFTAGMVTFSQTDIPWVFLLTGFFMGYGVSIAYAVCQASAISASPPHRYGVTTSTFAMITDLGSGLGPMFLGMVIAESGYRNMYLICSAICLSSLVIFWIVHGRKVMKGKTFIPDC